MPTEVPTKVPANFQLVPARCPQGAHCNSLVQICYEKLVGTLVGAPPKLVGALMGALVGAPPKLVGALVGAPPKLVGALVGTSPKISGYFTTIGLRLALVLGWTSAGLVTSTLYSFDY